MKLFDSELNIMEILWEVDEIKASELYRILEQKIGWNRNTTYTVLKKCIEKGFVERIEPHFVCRAILSREDAQKSSVFDLIAKLFHNSKGEFFQAFLDKKTLSPDEIEELKKIVNRLK